MLVFYRYLYSFRLLPILCIAIGMICCFANAEELKGAKEQKVQGPEIRRIVPFIGPSKGKKEVTIVGRNFRINCDVLFGATKAEVISVEKQGSLVRVICPAGRGEVAVTVRNPDNQSATIENAYFYGGGVGAKWFKFRHGLTLLWFWINVGSWVMYPIILLSFIALALIFHTLLAIRDNQLIPHRLVEDVAEYLSNGHLDNAAEYCRKKSCAYGRIVLSGIQRSNQSPEIIREAMASAGARESEHLHQKIHYLSNIGTIAPMMGLFGTVWGLQLAFQEIAGAGAQHQVLAAAITVALNTTVAGLIVGIGAFVGYFLFRGKVIRLVSTMEILSEEMAERIIQIKEGEDE